MIWGYVALVVLVVGAGGAVVWRVYRGGQAQQEVKQLKDDVDAAKRISEAQAGGVASRRGLADELRARGRDV